MPTPEDRAPTPQAPEPVESDDESIAFEEEDDGLRGADTALQQLEERLNGALSDLGQRNRQVEEYLEFLAQERRRELLGADAAQLTFDDVPPPPANSAEGQPPAPPAT